jgi:hypothetical protein
MTTTTHHLIVAGKIPTASGPLTVYSRGLIAGLTGNLHISSPQPPIVTLTGLLTASEAAETATISRTKGTVGTRNAARTALRSALKTEVATIQAAADADPDNAEAIITSTSLTTRKVPVRVKAPFAVKSGAVSGAAILEVRSAGSHASYDWQMSVDGGKTWTEIPSTTKAKTSVSALPVATTVQFRFRSLTPKGQSDWSQPIGLLVK